MTTSRPTFAYALLTLTALFWSGNFVLARAMHAAVPPMALSFGRWLIALTLLAPLALKPFWRSRHLLWAQRGRVLLLGACGIAGFNSCVYTGVQYTTATNAVLLNSFIPILTVLFGAMWFRQPFSPRKSFGLLVSFIGVIAIVSHGDWARLVALDLNRGDLIIFIAMILWALYTLLLRGLSPDIDRLGLMWALMAIGTLFILPFFLLEHAGGRVMEFNTPTLATLAYVGTLPSVAAYLFYNYGVAKVGPARAAGFTHLMPAFGALLSMLFLGEQLHLYHLAGIGLIFAGVFLSTRQQA